MIRPVRDLPLSYTALIFGLLGFPLAFTRHLVSLALVLGILAVTIGLWGRWRSRRTVGEHHRASVRRAIWAVRIGSLTILFSVVMWVLWATNVLLR